MNFEKMVGPILAPCLRICLFSGLDLAPWQKVDLATLYVALGQTSLETPVTA